MGQLMLSEVLKHTNYSRADSEVNSRHFSFQRTNGCSSTFNPIWLVQASIINNLSTLNSLKGSYQRQ